ncbi:histidine phosphatase family protein [Promicromonospora thailandica]|uniref:phosphoglycerate mutase (2,3-diphosphoglycerate-dependent) n=1 Tax=Promicromonospora thailandica TaxID=765201 RepID=A0A9X2G8G8_9MICO|nr:histidine phosphatase family protein [Promicromonospora thailandica]MCP2265089.1 putative phosphoglycerate mutase [Promicromonospora thailandica]BFF19848.1 histidine phosphatase family protein [Promicromonospora thailandica]
MSHEPQPLTPPRDPQLVLLRHGETEWSRSGQHTGRTDLPLTAAGEEQARFAGATLARYEFAAVRTSPLTRARRTAELAGYPDAVVDDDLAEWDYGPVDGRTSRDVSAELGREFQIFDDGVRVLPPSAEHGDGRPGETLEDVAARAARVVARAEETLTDGGDVLLVAHGHLLRVLATVWLGVDPRLGARFELGTAAVCLLGYGHSLRTVEGWNLAAQ